MIIKASFSVRLYVGPELRAPVLDFAVDSLETPAVLGMGQSPHMHGPLVLNN